MGLLNNIRAYLLARDLKKRRNQHQLSARKRMNFAQAKAIGILFEATKLETRNQALAYAKKLREKDKKVTLLGYFDNKQEHADFPFNYFTRTHVDWARRPKSQDVDFFLQAPYDIFIHLNPAPTPITEHIAALTEAHLKVGPASGTIEHYDLMVDVADLPAFIQQIDLLFQKTNVDHEATQS